MQLQYNVSSGLSCASAGPIGAIWNRPCSARSSPLPPLTEATPASLCATKTGSWLSDPCPIQFEIFYFSVILGKPNNCIYPCISQCWHFLNDKNSNMKIPDMCIFHQDLITSNEKKMLGKIHQNILRLRLHCRNPGNPMLRKNVYCFFGVLKKSHCYRSVLFHKITSVDFSIYSCEILFIHIKGLLLTYYNENGLKC